MHFVTLSAALLASASTSAASPMLGHRRSYTSVSSVSQDAWNSLNQSVSGRLQKGVPMMQPCFHTVNGKMHATDDSQCNTLQSKKMNDQVVSDHFGGYENANWGSCQATGDTCSLSILATPDLTTPLVGNCKQGSVPNMYVDARNVSDIQHSLAFASKNNLRLVIKNTGHDYKGRSSAPDSFAIWTHNYNPNPKLEKNFIPEGGSKPVGDVITSGAGQQFIGLYEFASKNGYRVVGGTSSTVGANGGWIAGGGHSMLANELGLGVDNAQQIKVVLPNGTYVTSNRYQNTDLFFALRGGGGGTFGVITEVSYLAHADKPMVYAGFNLTSLNPSNIDKLMTILVDNADKWANEGFGGYLMPGQLTSAFTKLEFATSLLNESQARESLKPLTDFASNVLRLEMGATSIKTESGFWDTFLNFRGLDNQNDVGLAMSSRIITRKYFQQDNLKSQLAKILADIGKSSSNVSLPTMPLFINVVGPMLYSQKLPESDKPGGPGYASITPAWRDAVWHVIHTAPFNPVGQSPSTINTIFQQTHDAMKPLRDLTPDTGAYQNEADTFEPDPVGSYWGQDNYNRLVQIKKEVDPSNLLTVHQGIDWDSSDGRYSCYPAAPSS